MYQSSHVYQNCTNSVPIVKNSQKTVKTAKMTIGIPIVTCPHSPMNTQSASRDGANCHCVSQITTTATVTSWVACACRRSSPCVVYIIRYAIKLVDAKGRSRLTDKGRDFQYSSTPFVSLSVRCIVCGIKSDQLNDQFRPPSRSKLPPDVISNALPTAGPP